ncbi:hypothetical protein [uncultured Methylobacterium sp.]|uniref:hypothetical protein n=1 Tax=uncultured Methylobacterium sp. TaxID=157278 RepID=UPI0035C98D93
MADENPGILAMFFTDAVRMNFASEQAGRDIFEDREHVKIVIAGDKHSEVVREATDVDRERFHEVYRRFRAKASEREQIVGTILDAAPFLSPSQRKEMESLNIFTVEQLAALSDTAKQKIGMGANEMVAKAQAFLKVAADTGHATALAAQAERQNDEIAALKEQIRELASKLEAAVKPAASPAGAPARR